MLFVFLFIVFVILISYTTCNLKRLMTYIQVCFLTPTFEHPACSEHLTLTGSLWVLLKAAWWMENICWRISWSREELAVKWMTWLTLNAQLLIILLKVFKGGINPVQDKAILNNIWKYLSRIALVTLSSPHSEVLVAT